MIRVSAKPTEEEVYKFATEWTECLVSEDYKRAYEMLHYVKDYPGRSWVSSPEKLKAWIVNYGTDEPIEGEPIYKVTPIESATGERWNNDLELNPVSEIYPGYVGYLDWWLPLDGEWSDLMASFELVKVKDGVAFVLRALRVP